jgi:hypothetical protein
MSGEVAIGQSYDPQQKSKVRLAAYSFAVTVSPIVIGAASISASSLTITALQKLVFTYKVCFNMEKIYS